MTETLLTASQRTLGVVRMLAAELENSPVPATVTLESHLRRRIGNQASLRLRVTGPDPHPGIRQLTDEEEHRLGAPGLVQCCWRTAVLLCGPEDKDIAAAVTLTWLPARLPAGACTALAGGKAPAGKALAGMERTDRRALALTERESDPGDDGLDIAVKSSAVLLVGGWKAAIATERVTQLFAELLAG